MLNATFRPLTQWPPGPRTESKKCDQFEATWLQTLNLLEYELGKLRAKDVVIQIEDPEAIKGIRNDGSIRIVSKMHFPKLSGIVLSFESPKGNISMPCDRYDYWQANIRAIALSLEALRAVDRYGVTKGNEQYRGWTQLEAPTNGMTKEQARSFLQSLTDNVPLGPAATPELIANLCRALKIKNHPDRGGSHDLFVKIGQAEAVLCGEGGK